MTKALVNLAKIRRLQGKSQADLGATTGLAQPYISSLERGLLPSDPSHVLWLATALGVQPEVLTAAQIHIDCSSLTNTVAVQSR